MGQHRIICKFPCGDEVLFCIECAEAEKYKRKIVNGVARELQKLWGQDCERMNKEINRLNNELEEKKRNETESEKEET